jgi:hypothetical protein
VEDAISPIPRRNEGELIGFMQRLYPRALLDYALERRRRLRETARFVQGSDADTAAGAEQPQRNSREERARLRQALVFLLGEAKTLGYLDVVRHLRRALQTLL